MGNKAAVRRGQKNRPAGKAQADSAREAQTGQRQQETDAERRAREVAEARKRLMSEQQEIDARKRREAEEEERRKRAEEEERRKQAEEEERIRQEEEEERRLREEEEERLRLEEEEARLRAEEEEREYRRRQAEERRRKQEEERRRIEEEEERIEAEVERRLYRLREQEAAKVVVSPKAVRARRGTVLAAIAAVLLLGVLSVILGIRYDKVRRERDAAMEDLARYRSLVSSEVQEEENPEAGTAPSPEQETAKVVPKDGIRRVYLTFDDGPTAVTGEVLDILKTYDVKATFFVLGREDEASKALYNRIVDEGHTLAMHSFDHDFTRLYASLDSFSADTLRLRNFLYEVTDGRVWAKIYRFPGGSSTTTARAEIPELIDWLGRENITYFDWNVYGGDDIAPEVIVSNVKANVEKYENAVILMHDGADKDETVEALPEIIEYLQGLEGTKLLPITEDTAPVQHGNM